MEEKEEGKDTPQYTFYRHTLPNTPVYPCFLFNDNELLAYESKEALDFTPVLLESNTNQAAFDKFKEKINNIDDATLLTKEQTARIRFMALKIEVNKRYDYKNILQSAILAAGVSGQTYVILNSIVNLVEKSVKSAVAQFEKLKPVQGVHYASMTLSALSLLMKIIKQSWMLLTLDKEGRKLWWQKKSAQKKAAFIMESILIAVTLILVIASIACPAVGAILSAACYVANSVIAFINTIQKFPKTLDGLRNQTDTNEQHKLRITAVKQLSAVLFNAAFVVGAILTVVAPPIGAIVLGIALLANIAFFIATALVSKLLINDEKKQKEKSQDIKSDLMGVKDTDKKSDLQIIEGKSALN